MSAIQSPSAGSAGIPDNMCQVVPADGEPPCPKPAQKWAAQPGKDDFEQDEVRVLCREHNAKRRELYFAYKAASSKVEGLGDAVKDPGFRNSDRLGREKVKEAIAKREELGAAIDEELKGRENHRKQFVLKVDTGHARRAEFLQRAKKTNTVILQRLYHRRGVLGTESYTARTVEEVRQPERQVDTEQLRAAAKMQQEAEEVRKRREAEAESRRQAADAERRRREEERRRQRDEAERQERQRAARELAEASEAERRRRTQQQMAARLSERIRQLAAAEEANARRAREATRAAPPAVRETQPLLGRVERQASQLQPAHIFPQVPRSQPYVPRAAPRAVSTPSYGTDVEQQDAALGRARGDETGHCLWSVLEPVCCVLLVGVCGFIFFVKVVG